MLMPALAYANIAFGFAWAIGLEFLIALIPVIILEGLVLGAMLRLPGMRALNLATEANLVSAAAGLVLGLPLVNYALLAGAYAWLEPNRVNAVFLIAPLLLPSWWIEYRWIARRDPALDISRVRWASGVANVLSYAALLAYTWTAFPEPGVNRVRALVRDAYQASDQVRQDVVAFRTKQGRLPDSLKELGYPPAEAEGFDVPMRRLDLWGNNSGPTSRLNLSLQTAGRISVQFLGPEHPVIDRKRIVLSPVVEQPARGQPVIRWQCSAPDLPQSLLPEGCVPEG
jgi:hypothetical protein